MKQLFYLSILVLSIACGKKSGSSDTPDPRRVPINHLNKLGTITSDLPAAYYRDMTFLNETTGFAIADGRIVKTTDGGQHWTSIPCPTQMLLNKIQFTSPETGYIVGGDNESGILLKTTDGGDSWTLSTLNAMERPAGMYFLNDDNGYITACNQ